MCGERENKSLCDEAHRVTTSGHWVKLCELSCRWLALQRAPISDTMGIDRRLVRACAQVVLCSTFFRFFPSQQYAM